MNKVAQSYNRLAQGYDADYGTPMDRAEEREISRLVKPYLDGTVLDAGCGTGLLLDLHPNIDSYHGVDISAGMLEKHKEKHPSHITYCGDAWQSGVTKMLSPDNVVSLFGSPSYCNPRKVSHGVQQMLKPGGRFFLMPYAAGRFKTASKGNHLVDAHAALWYDTSAASWRELLEHEGASNVVVRGFNLLGSKRLLRAEAPLTRRFPDRCQYLIITGVI